MALMNAITGAKMPSIPFAQALVKKQRHVDIWPKIVLLVVLFQSVQDRVLDFQVAVMG